MKYHSAALLLAGLLGPARPRPVPLDGFWKTDGYGYALALAHDTLSAFEVTQTTCLPAWRAARSRATGAGNEASFETDGEVFFVRAGPGADVKRLHSDGAASDMIIRRIPRLPAVCDHPTQNTPAENFEVFWRTWAEHYILFDAKHVDWQKVVDSVRPLVKATTTPSQLFDVFEAMIGRFHDAHTFIGAPDIKRQFRNLRTGTDRVAKHGMEHFRDQDLPALLQTVEQHYLQGPLRKWCQDQVQYGHLNDSTGYLRILSEGRYTKEGGFAAGLVALEAALDTIFSDRKLKGLVIDVRINFGGADPYGLALASRLTAKEYLAYSKEARLDPMDHGKWTPGQPSFVRPSSRPSFHGPVVELTGPLTISAGETTTQALMGRSPKVVRIGENTQGVFSDVLGRKLPNGWRFGLPNEVFRAADGRTFDGPGIPPDIEVPVFADQDVAAGKDPAVIRALAELARH